MKKFHSKEEALTLKTPNPKRKNFKNMTGFKSGKLTVHFWGGITAGRNKWWCTCQCSPSKYFLVDKTSLVRGVTTSCGCKYKNNGKSVPESLASANSKIKNLTLSTFNGWNYTAEATCNVCGKFYKGKAYNLRQTVCCQGENTAETIKENLKLLGFNYEGVGNTTTCKHCGVERNLREIRERCPCQELPDSSSPCSVYILEDTEHRLIKIGKALNHSVRSDQVITSAAKLGYNFKLRHYVYVSGEKAAYNLETTLHRHFYKYKAKGIPKFDGSTEVFSVSLEDCMTYLDNLSDMLDNLKAKDYSPPMHMISPTM